MRRPNERIKRRRALFDTDPVDALLYALGVFRRLWISSNLPTSGSEQALRKAREGSPPAPESAHIGEHDDKPTYED